MNEAQHTQAQVPVQRDNDCASPKRQRLDPCTALLEHTIDELSCSGQIILFNVVVSHWRSKLKQQPIELLALAAACKGLFKIVTPLINERASTSVARARDAQLYRCRNIVIGVDDKCETLGELFEKCPQLTLTSLKLIRQDSTNLYVELKTITTLMDTPSPSSPSKTKAALNFSFILHLDYVMLPHSLSWPQHTHTIKLHAANGAIAKPNFPPSLHTFRFYGHLNLMARFPSQLRSLTVGQYYRYLTPPSSITTLKLNNYEGLIDKDLFPKLEVLSLRGEFNTLLDNLPASLRFLRLKHGVHNHNKEQIPHKKKLPEPGYVHELDFPPPNMKQATHNFNKKEHENIPGPGYLPELYFPPNLRQDAHNKEDKKDMLGHGYYNLDSLPPKLCTLILRLPNNYNHTLSLLPHSLQILKVSCQNVSQILEIIPPQLKHLTVTSSSKFTINTQLPNTLITAKLKGCLGSFTSYPPSLKVLHLGSIHPVVNSPQGLAPQDQATLERLIQVSPSLHAIVYPAIFNSPVTFIPTTPAILTRIQFGTCFNRPIDDLPTSIKYIGFNAQTPLHTAFNQKLNLSKLTNLLEFRFISSSSFNQPITADSFPPSLKALQFVGVPMISYTARIQHRQKITKSQWTSLFDQVLNDQNMPKGLQELTLGPSFQQTLDPLVVSNLHTLIIDSKYPHSLPSTTCTVKRYVMDNVAMKKKGRRKHK